MFGSDLSSARTTFQSMLLTEEHFKITKFGAEITLS